MKVPDFSILEIGWDGYNADPPNEVAIDKAERYTEWTKEHPPDNPKHWESILIRPTVEGGVAFIFRDKPWTQKKVVIEFFNDGEIYALFSDQPKDPHSEKVESFTILNNRICNFFGRDDSGKLEV